MIGKEISSRRDASLAEIKEILAARKKESELTYEQDLAYKYVKAHAKLNKAKTDKLIEELLGLGIDKKLAIKLADILPWEPEILNLLIPKESEITKENLEKILELVQKYAGKKGKKK